MTMSRRMASPHLFKQYLNNELRSIGNELQHLGMEPGLLSISASRPDQPELPSLQETANSLPNSPAWRDEDAGENCNWKLRTEDATHKTQHENLNALSTIVTIFPVNSAGADLHSDRDFHGCDGKSASQDRKLICSDQR